MRVGLIAVDSKYPNLALMKISAYHKQEGDIVEWYNPYEHYDLVYASKIFTYTPDYEYAITNADRVLKGGTGYDLTTVLPDYIDLLQPDYTLYNVDDDLAYGFITRGCPNKCKWCVVPIKEGKIQPYMDIEDIVAGGKRRAILMDNNVIGSSYGVSQLEKIAQLGVKVDFNQAIDARLVTDEIAAILARVRWIRYIRFGCDTPGQIKEVERAAELLTNHGYRKPIFLYCLLQDFDESLARVEYWRHKGPRFIPFCQPYRDIANPSVVVPQWQKDMARWANMRAIYRSCDFADYSPRKGFICREYFNLLR